MPRIERSFQFGKEVLGMDFNKIMEVKLLYKDERKIENSGLLGYLCLCGLK